MQTLMFGNLKNKFLCYLILIFLTACYQNSHSQILNEDSQLATENYLLIRSNLYQDKNGTLYIRLRDEHLNIMYVSTLDVSGEQKTISDIVDKKTYRNIGVSAYAQDKNHFYQLTGNKVAIVSQVPCLIDNPDYQQIKDNLYQSRNSKQLYIRTVDSTQALCPKYKYISSIVTPSGDIPIARVIDSKTYYQLFPSNYSLDKQNVYFLRETLDGGYFKILPEIQPKDFQLISINGVEFGKYLDMYFYNGYLLTEEEILKLKQNN